MSNSSSAAATRLWVVVVVILVVLGVSFLFDHCPVARLPSTPSTTSDPNGVSMLSIGDGVETEIQPDGRFSGMTERRDLRPNLIHINKTNRYISKKKSEILIGKEKSSQIWKKH